MNLKARITRIEQRRGNGWTSCPDPCHEPPGPFDRRPVDWRRALWPFLAPEERAELEPPPGLACPTCGEPPDGITIIPRRWDEDLPAPAGDDDKEYRP